MLIHGVGATGEAWDTWVPYLAAKFPTITLDLPGHGESVAASVPEGDVSAWREDVMDVISASGHSSAHLVGESFGGTMAMYLAATRPDLVRSLTVVSATHRGDWVEGLPGWRAMLEAPGGFQDWCQMMLRNRFGSHELQPGFLDWFAARQEHTTVESVLAVAEGLLATDLTPLLGNIHQPVLLVAPEASPFLSDRVPRQLHSLLPGSTLVEVPGAQHGVAFSHPYECLQAVVDAGALPLAPLGLPERHGFTQGGSREDR